MHQHTTSEYPAETEHDLTEASYAAEQKSVKIFGRGRQRTPTSPSRIEHEDHGAAQIKIPTFLKARIGSRGVNQVDLSIPTAFCDDACFSRMLCNRLSAPGAWTGLHSAAWQSGLHAICPHMRKM